MILSKLPQDLRKVIAKPHGLVIIDRHEFVASVLHKFIHKGYEVIAVGDVVTSTCVKHRIKLKLGIVDFKTLRKEAVLLKLNELSTYFDKILTIVNPAGYLSKEASLRLKELLEDTKSYLVIVDGEEDLLIMPALLYAPNNSLVIYGIPSLGVGMFLVNPEVKVIVKALVENFTAMLKLKIPKT
ncbi:MAG TPA: DUF359 domain-containing protein [Acidilobales archaeon]|nr:DUF359 domain-containing protein [Acidilobales archaeon]